MSIITKSSEKSTASAHANVFIRGTKAEIEVFSYLRALETTDVIVSHESISRATNVSLRSVRRGINRLAERGWLTVQNRKGPRGWYWPSRYKLHPPGGGAVVEKPVENVGSVQRPLLADGQPDGWPISFHFATCLAVSSTIQYLFSSGHMAAHGRPKVAAVGLVGLQKSTLNRSRLTRAREKRRPTPAPSCGKPGPLFNDIPQSPNERLEPLNAKAQCEDVLPSFTNVVDISTDEPCVPTSCQSVADPLPNPRTTNGQPTVEASQDIPRSPQSKLKSAKEIMAENPLFARLLAADKVDDKVATDCGPNATHFAPSNEEAKSEVTAKPEYDGLKSRPDVGPPTKEKGIERQIFTVPARARVASPANRPPDDATLAPGAPANGGLDPDQAAPANPVSRQDLERVRAAVMQFKALKNGQPVPSDDFSLARLVEYGAGDVDRVVFAIEDAYEFVKYNFKSWPEHRAWFYKVVRDGFRFGPQRERSWHRRERRA